MNLALAEKRGFRWYFLKLRLAGDTCIAAPPRNDNNAHLTITIEGTLQVGLRIYLKFQVSGKLLGEKFTKTFYG